MLVYPNRMSFDIMPNGGQPPTPKGLLHIKVLDVDVASGGLPIPIPHLHKARPPGLLDLASGGLPVPHLHMRGAPRACFIRPSGPRAQLSYRVM